MIISDYKFLSTLSEKDIVDNYSDSLFRNKFIGALSNLMSNNVDYVIYKNIITANTLNEMSKYSHLEGLIKQGNFLEFVIENGFVGIIEDYLRKINPEILYDVISNMYSKDIDNLPHETKLIIISKKIPDLRVTLNKLPDIEFLKEHYNYISFSDEIIKQLPSIPKELWFCILSKKDLIYRKMTIIDFATIVDRLSYNDKLIDFNDRYYNSDFTNSYDEYSNFWNFIGIDDLSVDEVTGSDGAQLALNTFGFLYKGYTIQNPIFVRYDASVIDSNFYRKASVEFGYKDSNTDKDLGTIDFMNSVVQIDNSRTESGSSSIALDAYMRGTIKNIIFKVTGNSYSALGNILHYYGDSSKTLLFENIVFDFSELEYRYLLYLNGSNLKFNNCIFILPSDNKNVNRNRGSYDFGNSVFLTKEEKYKINDYKFYSKYNNNLVKILLEDNYFKVFTDYSYNVVINKYYKKFYNK